MIDDYERAMELLHEMEAQLPIPARPTATMVRALRDQGQRISREKKIRAYQQERKRRLAQAGGSREPSSFTLYPREEKRRR